MQPPGSRDPAADKPNPFARAETPAASRNPAQDARDGQGSGGGPPGPDGGAEDRFLTPAPSVSLPQGGGAIRGIGETFQANPVTGTAGMSVPIAVSPSPRGLAPQLSLSYDSGAGNGPFGLGWQLSTASIRRKTDKGLPRYRDTPDGQGESDVFQLAGAEDLVPWLDGSGAPLMRTATEDTVTYTVLRYRPRIEGAFARIERWTSQATGDVHWRTLTGDNTWRIFGRSTAARVVDPDDSTRVFQWLLEEVQDERGNVMVFSYKAEDRANVSVSEPAERARGLAGHQATFTYLKSIDYGNKSMGTASGGFHFRVVFDYGEHTASPPTASEDSDWPVRADPYSTFRPGFDHRCYRLCQRVLMFHDFTELGTGWTLVRSTEFVYDEQPHCTKLTSVTHRGWKKDGSSWTNQALPPVAFTYTQAEVDSQVRFVDGVEDLPTALDVSQYQWVDLDGEGLTGLLTERAGAWFYKRNDGQGALGPMRRLGSRPAVSLRGSRLMDLDGNGQLDVVQIARPPKGFYERDVDGGWESFRAFKRVPNVNLDDPNLRMLDLDGDGHADVLITEDRVYRWYPSEAKDGYGPAEVRTKARREDDGPTLVFGNESEHIFLADMTGDGLTDLVRIRRTSVEYWPNRGYGRFGARVVLGNQPTFDRHGRFDPRRVRLADVDGSGPTDILYLGASGVDVYVNQSGNRFADASRLAGFPAIDNVAQVSVADLLGDGTACLVWSSPLLRGSMAPLRYVHLMKQGKPHLLKTITNNLGRTTTLTYTPSTAFYTADRRAGTPWATRLPFPVHCLSKVEMEDGVTGWKFASTYTFHHGYFDGPEREFRGFGLVVQRDTESVTDFADATNGDVAHHLDPVVTKTWFHTGAWRQEQRLTDAYAAEAWDGDSSASALPTPSIPSGLSPQELREAHRTLRGSPLRVEVYAEDGSSSADKPYSVSESTYAVKQVQAQQGQRHAVFQLIPSETRSSAYERNADDPRVSHTLVLETDAYGQVLTSAAVGYKRRAAQITAASPPSPVDTEQARTHVTVSTASFIHDDGDADRYHLFVPYEAETFQLTGVDADDTAPFTATELLAAFNTATEIQYEAAPTTGTQKRRLARTRTLYWKDDLSGPDAYGEMESRALPYEQYQQVYTAGLVGGSGPWGSIGSTLGTGYAAPTTSGSGNDLETAGYVQPFTGNTDWWRRSGVTALLSGQFYMPDDHTDPFGNTTSVTYDSYGVFVSSITDALTTNANVVEAQHDYRVLAPWEVKDPNGAKQQAAFDALGRVTAMAVLGTASEGDTLSAPTAQFTYEVDRYYTTGVPNRVKVEQRKVHGVAGFQEQYAYSDGGGGVVMTKVQAEPGDAPERDGSGNLVFDGTTGELLYAHADPRWIGTGRTIVDNKGNPIKQFEPFFSDTYEYEDDDNLVEWGVTPVLTYDPLGRNIRVDLPDGTFSTAFFDPWRSEAWDGADNVEDSDWHNARKATATPTPSTENQRAATLSLAHKETPGITHMDALGRAIVSIEDLGSGTTYQTTLAVSLQGFVLAVQGEKGRSATSAYNDQEEQYDMIGRPMRSTSADAGVTWAHVAVDGQPIRVWREGPVCVHSEYDELRRPTALKVQEGAGVTATRTHEKLEYGEAGGAPSGAGQYHKGRVWRVSDGAGRVTADSYEVKGSPASVTREVIARAQVGGAVDWDGTAPTLESTTFTVASTFDALGRLVTETTPDASIKKYAYNTAGLLHTVKVDVRAAGSDTDFVDNIDYDEKGRRTRIEYANGTKTAYTYDPLTFRLVRLKTTNTSGSVIHQDLTYTYDAVGNIVELQDAAQQTIYFSNTPASPTQKFTYDAIYRLTNVQGREKTGGTSMHIQDDPTIATGFPNAEVMRPYERRYQYDGVGNITQMKHLAGGGSGNWTRDYTYDGGSNRLASTTNPLGGSDVTYNHNVRGAMTEMPHLNFTTTGTSDPMVRDFRDQLSSVSMASSTSAAYQYDPTRERVRKVWDKGSLVEERIYLGSWELWRTFNGSGVLQDRRETLHVLDGEKRVAMVETLTLESAGTPSGGIVSRTRFQYGNQLGSACLELDPSGNLISYEEYYPYGSTSWWAEKSAIQVSRKRYRYIGKEKDEETGLHYHSARYYAGWLGRWCSSDPAGLVDGVGRYAYVGGRPVGWLDRSGFGRTWGQWANQTISTWVPAPVQGAVKETAKFGLGVVGQWSSNNLPVGTNDPALDKIKSVSFQRGRAVGDLASVVTGGAEMVGGADLIASTPAFMATGATIGGGGGGIAGGAGGTAAAPGPGTAAGVIGGAGGGAIVGALAGGVVAVVGGVILIAHGGQTASRGLSGLATRSYGGGGGGPHGSSGGGSNPGPSGSGSTAGGGGGGNGNSGANTGSTGGSKSSSGGTTPGEKTETLGTDHSAAGTSRTYEVDDGVRRAKATELVHGEDATHPAIVRDAQGNILEERDIPIRDLRSPHKDAIEYSTSPGSARRFDSVVEGVKEGATPPIEVRPGSQGIPIKDVGFK